MAFTSHADAAFDVCFDNTMTDCMYPSPSHLAATTTTTTTATTTTLLEYHGGGLGR